MSFGPCRTCLWWKAGYKRGADNALWGDCLNPECDFDRTEETFDACDKHERVAGEPED